MKNYLNLIIVLISLATVLSGLAQVVAPTFVLNTIGAEGTPATAYLFSVIGMFMALFGGMMLHALYSPHSNKVATMWAGFQKLGAAFAVGIGIMYGVFSTLAIGVAVFDLFSGIIFLYYHSTLSVYEVA